MASDLSRVTFDNKKNYSGVLLQQGRVLLDADWNEQLDIHQHRLHTQTNDVIGKCGVPKNTGGFRITQTGGGTNLSIAKGRIYVDGLLCQLSSNVLYTGQPFYPDPPHVMPPSSPPLPNTELQLEDGWHIVYIKAWQREINYLDDPLIQEVALGEADTTTRLQTVWQVEIIKGENNLTCVAYSKVWKDKIARSTGQLSVIVDASATNGDPCGLTAEGGYKRLENQLYRIEIHTKGDENSATFKWSRDNASVETKIFGIGGDGNGDTVFAVDSIGKDYVLGFATGQWVELIDDVSSLNQLPKDLLLVKNVDPSTNEITVDLPQGNIIFAEGMKLRRWDQKVNATQSGVDVGSGFLDIEDGIQVSFSAGTYHSGDYWLIPARTVTRNVELPRDVNGNPIPQSPLGIQYGYCKLAIIEVSNNLIRRRIEDCRPIFPTLTEICAEDICYKSKGCDLTKGAQTVQEALDILCEKREGSCTYHVLPKPGWEKVFDEIKDKGDAQICFQVGIYPLPKKVKPVENKGHLKLIGCGFGTKILAPGSEAALTFLNCESVLIRDLYCEASKTHLGTGNMSPNSPKVFLNGALTLINCKTVNIENLRLKNGAGSSRMATCLTIYYDYEKGGDVRVLNTDFAVGYRQNGILIVNAKNALVQNNRLKTYPKPLKLTAVSMAVADKRYRLELANWFASDFEVKEKKSDKKTAIRLKNDRYAVFKTHHSLTNTWTKILREAPPEKTESNDGLKSYFNTTFNRVVYEPAYLGKYPQLKESFEFIDNQSVSFMGQGITVAGRQGDNIRVLNNDVNGALDAIHIGFSHQNNKGEPYYSKCLMIDGNTIYIPLPAFVGQSGRFGIYCGNSSNTTIQNNIIQLERLMDFGKTVRVNDLNIEGIRAWGEFKVRMMIRNNTILSYDQLRENSFDVAIRMHPIAAKGNMALWAINDNLAIAKDTNMSIKEEGEIGPPISNNNII